MKEDLAGDSVYRKRFKPGDDPEAEFEVDGDNISMRAYCNVHRLWLAKAC